MGAAAKRSIEAGEEEEEEEDVAVKTGAGQQGPNALAKGLIRRGEQHQPSERILHPSVVA